MQRKQLPDLVIGPTPNNQTTHRAQYIREDGHGKPQHMGSSYDISPEALRLEEDGQKTTRLNGYRREPTLELALSTPNVPLDVAGPPFSVPGATYGHPFPTWPAPHHVQSWLQHDHHWNQQDRSLQPHQSPPAIVAGASTQSDIAFDLTKVTTEKPAKRGAGRPPGSKNKPKSANPDTPKEKRKRGRPPGSRNKPKVTAAFESLESSPNLHYQNNGRTKGDNIGQERREHKIAVRHNSSANLFSQNQHVVYQHIPTQQPLSAGQAHQAYGGHLQPAQYQHLHAQHPLITNTPTGSTHPTTLAQDNFPGQIGTYQVLPAYDVYQETWGHDENLSSSQGQHVGTLQPSSTNTSPLTSYTYPTTIDQNDHVGQDETHYTLPIDKANHAIQAYDVRIPSSQVQHMHTQQPLSLENLSVHTWLTTRDQQNYLAQDGNMSISPASNGHQVYQVPAENLPSSQDQHLSGHFALENTISKEELDRLFQPYPHPLAKEADEESQLGMSFANVLALQVANAQMTEMERANGQRLHL